jgi:hypothetical protein
MNTRSADCETVVVLAEHDRYVVARITAPDAPRVAVYKVHLSDDADLFEQAYAVGLVPRSAACVEVISMDLDPVTDGQPGRKLVYRHVL